MRDRVERYSRSRSRSCEVYDSGSTNLKSSRVNHKPLAPRDFQNWRGRSRGQEGARPYVESLVWERERMENRLFRDIVAMSRAPRMFPRVWENAPWQNGSVYLGLRRWFDPQGKSVPAVRWGVGNKHRVSRRVYQHPILCLTCRSVKLRCLVPCSQLVVPAASLLPQ